MFKVTARTILELGSELISSDIIAFYELVKNAFDAKSKTGADITFRIVLRRNAYLRIRDRLQAGVLEDLSKAEKRNAESALIAEATRQISEALDPAAGPEIVKAFQKAIAGADSIAKLTEKLDEAYRSLNTITVADTGTGMSLQELRTNYLTIGTASRKREVDQAVAAGLPKTPFLGEKGIGRLPAMRLGNRLHLETARAEDKSFNVLDVDWRRFDVLDAMVEDIAIKPVKGARKDDSAWSGTRLEIATLPRIGRKRGFGSSPNTSSRVSPTRFSIQKSVPASLSTGMTPGYPFHGWTGHSSNMHMPPSAVSTQ